MPRGPVSSADGLQIRQALEDANTSPSDPEVSDLDKRNMAGILIQKVLPRKEGADIYFVPGAFMSGDGDTASRSTFYTTCIGMSTHR